LSHPPASEAAYARIESIDLLRGLVMILMMLDHVRMYFGQGTWYADPTNLATTSPQLFLTRWITHFCAPVFVFLAGTSTCLYGRKKENRQGTTHYLLARGVWLIFLELTVVNLAWTFDITYSFLILQVIWAIGLSMIALSVLVFLPRQWILVTGLALVFGHNLLDLISVRGSSLLHLLWYTLHQPHSMLVQDTLINFAYPVLPWMGLMALGYVFGDWYAKEVPPAKRRQWLWSLGIGATLLFLLLRGFNWYGEPREWHMHASPLWTLMSFLNTTKYPPSLHFLLMTMGPSLILLAAVDGIRSRLVQPIITLGGVPFFFYIVHLYVIHALAILLLVQQGGEASDYILSAREIMSGRLRNFGFELDVVYIIWIALIVLLYPLCKWYGRFKRAHRSSGWQSYLSRTL
jgi:uncharacterized membrane protein